MSDHASRSTARPSRSPLLDLKRLYWNPGRFHAGRRKDQMQYDLPCLDPPELGCWGCLKRTPEGLREGLSAQEEAA